MPGNYNANDVNTLNTLCAYSFLRFARPILAEYASYISEEVWEFLEGDGVQFGGRVAASIQ